MNRLTQETKDKMVQLHNEGKSIYEIAKELGLAYVHVAYYLKPDFKEKLKASNAKSYQKRKEAKAKATPEATTPPTTETAKVD